MSNNEVNQSSGSGNSGHGRYVPPHLRNRQPAPAREQDSGPRGRGRQAWGRDDGRQDSRGGNSWDRGDRGYGGRQDSRGYGGRSGGYGGRSGGYGGRSGGYNNRSGGYGGGGRRGGWNSTPRGRTQPTMDRDERLERALFGDGVASGDAQGMGIDFERYNDIPVDVSGENIPEPVATFSDAKFHEVLADNIKLSGYTIPTPIQKHACAISGAGRDLMGCAQTGSGKTAAFLFPMIQTLLRDPLPEFSGRRVFPLALILAPTRELATQIYKECCKFTYRTGIRAVVVYGGQSIGQQFHELEQGCDIIVATPGRLVDMLDRQRVCLKSIKFLIFDEADRMLDMGFEPQIRQIVSHYDMNSETRQTSMFSATFPKEIQRLAADFLNEYIFLAVGRVGSATENITQKVVYASDHEKNDKLMQILPECEGLTLIFVETKRAADQLEFWLSERGINATSIHGDRSQDEREHALKMFRKGHCPVLVATSVAARGLDIPNVLMVINYDLPSNVDDYVHRIGRTGRAGHRGTAIAFVNEQCRILNEVLENMLESKQEVEDWFQKLVQASHSWGRRGRGGRNKKHNFGGRDFRRDDRGNFNQQSYGGGGGYGNQRGGGGYGGGYGGGGGYGRSNGRSDGNWNRGGGGGGDGGWG